MRASIIAFSLLAAACTTAQGAAGLRFRPTAGFYSPGSTFGFTVQGALDASGSGLSVETHASITVQPNLDFGDALDPSYLDVPTGWGPGGR